MEADDLFIRCNQLESDVKRRQETNLSPDNRFVGFMIGGL